MLPVANPVSHTEPTVVSPVPMPMETDDPTVVGAGMTPSPAPPSLLPPPMAATPTVTTDWAEEVERDERMQERSPSASTSNVSSPLSEAPFYLSDSDMDCPPPASSSPFLSPNPYEALGEDEEMVDADVEGVAPNHTGPQREEVIPRRSARLAAKATPPLLL
jgi:hypothetical protein